MYYKLYLDWDSVYIKLEKITKNEEAYKEMISDLEKSNPLIFTPLSVSSAVYVDVRKENNITAIKQFLNEKELDLLNRFNVDNAMIQESLKNILN
jgi:hypothetical protein